MPVFKAYFIIIKKTLPSMIVYFAVFISMALLFIRLNGSQAATDFNAVKSKIVIQSGEETPLVSGLTNYLAQYADIITISDEGDGIQDALFFGKIDNALVIPAGFTESFLSGEGGVTMENIYGNMSENSVSLELLVGKYLDLARLYVLNVPGISQEELSAGVMKDLGVTARIDVAASGDQVKVSDLNDTFRYMAYPIIAVMFMGVTTIMMAFNSPEVSKRNLCAPLSSSRVSLNLFAGNAIFMVVVWVILCAVTAVLGKITALSPGIMLLFLNTLVFSIAALSIAFLAGKLIRSQIAQAALTNVLSLGMAFLGGIFVPQYLLGETVLKIGSFTPAYWYIKAIDTVRNISEFSFENLKPVYGDMLIQLGFAAACIVIALVATKQKKQTLESCVF